MSKIKRISIKEFREFGFLQELNRLFLHPLGMALEVKINDDGTEALGGIWDYREDAEGMTFAEIEPEMKEKMKRVKDFTKKKHKQRIKTLGFLIQEK